MGAHVGLWDVCELKRIFSKHTFIAAGRQTSVRVLLGTPIRC